MAGAPRLAELRFRISAIPENYCCTITDVSRFGTIGVYLCRYKGYKVRYLPEIRISEPIMKRFIAIIFIILLSMQVQGQEMTRLAYTSEARIPSMQAWELLRRAQDWVSVAEEPLNILIVSTHSIEHELDCEVWFQDYQPSPKIPHSYDILFHIYITCFDGWYVVNLTDIVARDRKSTRLNSSHQLRSRMPSSA